MSILIAEGRLWSSLRATQVFVVAAIVFTLALTGYADLARPRPASFACRGFSYVAEIFPPKSRQNTSDKPMCYFYSVGYPGTTWKVHAKLLWKAQLAGTPRTQNGPYQAVLSMRGDLVTINGGGGGSQKHTVVIYNPGGKLVKSYPLKSLTPLAERKGGLAKWGWHRGARYFFPRKTKVFYILLPWGKAMEFSLDDGTFKHGDAKGFLELAALASKQHADEEAHLLATSLRFSSITDVLQAKGPAKAMLRSLRSPRLYSDKEAEGFRKRLDALPERPKTLDAFVRALGIDRERLRFRMVRTGNATEWTDYHISRSYSVIVSLRLTGDALNPLPGGIRFARRLDADTGKPDAPVSADKPRR